MNTNQENLNPEEFGLLMNSLYKCIPKNKLINFWTALAKSENVNLYLMQCMGFNNNCIGHINLIKMENNIPRSADCNGICVDSNHEITINKRLYCTSCIRYINYEICPSCNGYKLEKTELIYDMYRTYIHHMSNADSINNIDSIDSIDLE